MRKVALYSALLLVGLALSQTVPAPGSSRVHFKEVIDILTVIGLGFIMIHVGYEFELDKSSLRQYGLDYVVAMMAAAFPWIFVTGYFLFVMLPPGAWGIAQAWKETLLAGRFAAPTSAGVLFAMLAAGGLARTWVFRKARVLAIFDDLDTVLLMVPLKMLMIGLAWQLGVIAVLMLGLLAMAWFWLNRLNWPITWRWTLVYATIIAAISKTIYLLSRAVSEEIPVHLEVLLPAFVLGCLISRPEPSLEPHESDSQRRDVLDTPAEQRAATVISAAFMLLVGLSMPPIFAETTLEPSSYTAAQPAIGWGLMTLHVLAITALSNIGKMFTFFFYKCKAHWRERLAVSITMWPRGEVGAGVLVLSLSYGIGGPVVTVAIVSLALNLALTGAFIAIVKQLLRSVPSQMPNQPERQV